MSRGRVVLAMSGGVDSSVSAHLLVEAGFEVIGLFMRTGAHEESSGENETCSTTSSAKKVRGCCSALDAGDAQRVADRLNLPFYALNFEQDFDRIKDYFADEYSRGRTPNPCVVCNTWLKFGKLWDYANAIGADYIATGHYAKIVSGPRGAELHRGDDPAKDQSYFLFGLQAHLLSRILFPIGGMVKGEVRELAESLGMGLARKPDSQEICFVPSGDYQDFLRKYRPESIGEPGPIVDAQGKQLGIHQGLSRYTIGQRKGLGIAVGEPRYVVSLEPEENRVVIGTAELLQRDSLDAERTNWLIDPPTEPIRCEVKIRYLHRAAGATVEIPESGLARVQFDEPQSAVTPGQAVVFYRDSQVLGGGWIAG
ncbi:MAG: tRNA 2-thiouridine(34) synthase MnmA [Planctomycetota bacterium]